MGLIQMGRALLGGLALWPRRPFSPRRRRRMPRPAIRTGRSASSCRSRPAAATTSSRVSSGRRPAEILGQPLVIENKPGAGGRIAAEYVMNQPRDGYTLFVGASGVMSIAAAAYPNLRVPPDQDVRAARDDRELPADRGDPAWIIRPRP